jgi:hypothetical protein
MLLLAALAATFIIRGAFAQNFLASGATGGAACSYSEEKCRRTVEELGLSLGGPESPFLSDKAETGCYAYESGIYAGMAFYGLADSGKEVQGEHELTPVQLPKYRLPGTYACEASGLEDLALGRPVVASSWQGWDNTDPANIVDGDSTTRWASRWYEPQWIYVDLGSDALLASVTINWQDAFATTYRIQASLDAHSWHDLGNQQRGNIGQVTTVLPSHSVGRYVRVYMESRHCIRQSDGSCDLQGFSMYDLEVYGTPIVQCQVQASDGSITELNDALSDAPGQTSSISSSGSCSRSYCHLACSNYTTAGTCPERCSWEGSTCKRRQFGGNYRLAKKFHVSSVRQFDPCKAEFGRRGHVADWADLEAMGNESLVSLLDQLGIDRTESGSPYKYIVTRDGATCSKQGVYLIERHSGDLPYSWTVLSSIGDLELGVDPYLTGSTAVLCKVEPLSALAIFIRVVAGCAVGAGIAAGVWVALLYSKRASKKVESEQAFDIENQTMRMSAEESRQLGINLYFVTHILPYEAQRKAEMLVNEILPKKTQLTKCEAELFKQYGKKTTLFAQAATSLWSEEKINVHDMTFIELSKIIAYGENAYGKGLVCPRDGMVDCSIVDAVHSSGHSQKATLFLSWVWGYKFSRALSALRNYHATHPEIRGESCFIWWCFFQNNQYRMLGSGEPQSFDSLRSVFSTQLRNVGNMCCMLDRTYDSTYVQRLWCLFEVYVAAEEEIPIEVMLPESSIMDMEKAIKTGGFKGLKANLVVEAEKATATYEADEQGIKALIQEMPGGYSTLNEIVSKSLKQSVKREIDKALELGANDPCLRVMPSQSIRDAHPQGNEPCLRVMPSQSIQQRIREEVLAI